MFRRYLLHSFFIGILLAMNATGCKSAYYNTWEKLGWHKRDILVDRVKDARDDQKIAQKQFQTTLERFMAVSKANPGELESRYRKLQAEFDRSESRANAVRDQIKSIQEVAADLFKEWEKELDQYNNAELRRSSEQKLRDTQKRYEQLIGVMRKAEGKMEPVLTAFRDQVLFLKHNLNAAAVASLQTTAANLEADVAGLIKDMEAAIAEANTFINEMGKE